MDLRGIKVEEGGGDAAENGSGGENEPAGDGGKDDGILA